MNDNNRNPAIRIHIDQQVFIDAILGAEEIEDATVVTEIVGFDRSDTDYVLEGALAFTGYVRQQGLEQKEVTAEDLLGDVASTVEEEDMTVQQIHCRMPFTLEVPISAQRTEFLNVTARVGTWNLHVLGPKWVHVRAELVVNGLTGGDGYRFRCGTQEEGFSNTGSAAYAGEYRSQEPADLEQNPDEQSYMQSQSQQPVNESPFAVDQPPYYEQPVNFQAEGNVSESWQRQFADAGRAEEGDSSFATPYISPFVAPSHPLTWDRSWPQPSVYGSQGAQDASSAIVNLSGSGTDAGFSSESAGNSVQNEAESGAVEADTRDASATFAADNGSTTRAEAAETVDYTSASVTQMSETEFANEASADASEVTEHAQEHDQTTDTQTSFHFAEVAESSTVQNEPQFKLQIKSKNEYESSTFHAMSKLMEMGNPTRETSASVTGAGIAYDISTSVSSDTNSTVAKDVSSTVAKDTSSTVANDTTTGVQVTRESSSVSSAVSASDLFSTSGSASVSGTVSPFTSKSKPIEKLDGVIGEAVPVTAEIEPFVSAQPGGVETILEPHVDQPVPVLPGTTMIEPVPVANGFFQQDELVEKAVESKTVVDVTVTEMPQASITIAEDKKYKQDHDRVYLWTELYPYLEESFQTLKFRIVQETDTLEKIAENYRIPTSEVARVNHLPSEHIDVGQLLYIPVRRH